MPGDQSSNHVDLSFLPVDPGVVLGQPGISKDDVVPSSQVEYIEVLCGYPSLDSESKLDLMLNHASRVIHPICISCIHRP